MLSIVDSQGVERQLGNVMAPAGGLKVGGAWPVYGDTPRTPLISRQRWADLIAGLGPGLDHPDLPPVHDQGQVRQCNGDATAAAGEFCRNAQGLPYVALSGADLYDRINGGADLGSRLEDAMAEMTSRGMGTAATSGLLWRPGMRQASAEERARFRVLEAWLCPEFEHCLSAVLSGFAIISGVLWFRNYEPDGEGWLPLVGKGEPGGHAIMGYRPVLRAALGERSKGRYGIAHLQSWGPGWGIQGRCVLPEAAFTHAIGGWWAVRQMTTEAGDLPALQGLTGATAPRPAEDSLPAVIAREPEVWRGQVDPADMDTAVICLPGGARWLAVLVTRQDGRASHWEMWASRKPKGWGFSLVPGPAAGAEAALWLRGRRGREVRGCPPWLRRALRGIASKAS